MDLSDCSISEGVGSPNLDVSWQDPDYNPDHLAFYYARALERSDVPLVNLGRRKSRGAAKARSEKDSTGASLDLTYLGDAAGELTVAVELIVINWVLC